MPSQLPPDRRESRNGDNDAVVPVSLPPENSNPLIYIFIIDLEKNMCTSM